MEKLIRSEGVASWPLLGLLPLKRLIPQDAHSLMDYADAGAVMLGALGDGPPAAKATSLALGTSGAVASAMTDYRLSLAKVIPIEVHEVIDYAFGFSAILAPFVFGYYKRAPLVAALHVSVGVGTVVASALTDYRAYLGVGHVRSSARARQSSFDRAPELPPDASQEAMGARQTDEELAEQSAPDGFGPAPAGYGPASAPATEQGGKGTFGSEGTGR